MPNYLQRFYPESRFGNFTDISGTIRFYLRVNALLLPHFTVLDIGCGRGSYTADLTDFERGLHTFKGRVDRVIGIDLDPVGATNPHLDEFRLIEGARWPVPDASVHLAVSDWTMEHVEDPDAFFAECRRVLAPGGYLCLRTANRLSYVAMMSRLIPNQLHTKILGKVQPDRDSKDVFPTVYRCNTVWKLRRALRAHDLEGCVFGREAEPSYLGFSWLSYAVGVAYQKIAPSVLGSTLYLFAQKRVCQTEDVPAPAGKAACATSMTKMP